jgi:hypothetical protein
VILDFGLRIADFGLRPSEIGSPCGILRRRFRLTAEIPQGKHFTGQGFWIEARPGATWLEYTAVAVILHEKNLFQ